MSGDLHLNIVSFDVPYPPNYGGVIDVFFKLRSLSRAGVKIHLHTFYYGRKRSPILEELCEEVLYYPRKSFGSLFNLRLPYIVKTRKSAKLLNNLLKNPYPVLFEGLHCTYYIDHPELEKRKKIVRMHNIEYVYYKHLAKVEKNRFKRIYFNIEANRLRKFQQKLSLAQYVAAISPSDDKILQLKHGNSFYLPVFHPNDKMSVHKGKGDYLLYHGNLGVGENNEAALFLVNEVLNDLKIPTIIAGNHPSTELQKAIAKHYHIKLVKPEVDDIYELIEKAQVNILPTFQDTGIKLKLLNALFKGRFCIVNSKMVKDTGLEELCIISDDASDMKEQLSYYFKKDFKQEDSYKREKVLFDLFGNDDNARVLIDKLSE